jgi:hypothetical protein
LLDTTGWSLAELGVIAWNFRARAAFLVSESKPEAPLSAVVEIVVAVAVAATALGVASGGVWCFAAAASFAGRFILGDAPGGFLAAPAGGLFVFP